MANKPTLLLLLLSSLLLLRPPLPASADTACPYPCYPTPTTTTPPVTNYYPPPAFVYPPPTTGYLPYYPPPSGYGGNFGGGSFGGGGYGGGGYGPPPPDPILPYFPYYFKNGLHNDQPSSYSSSSSLVGDLVFRMRLTSLKVVIMAFFVVFCLEFALF